jgi:photosystem II stability/assembly factor-like uncharacterized protein
MNRINVLLLSACILLLSMAALIIQPATFFLNKKNTSPNKPFDDYALTSQYGHEGEGLQEYKMAVLCELKRMKKYRSTTTPWKLEGPTNTGGRINAIALHPTLATTYLVGCADGGIFKTTDDGATWTPIFDNAYALAISDIQYDPSNAQIIYVGTGDHVLGGYSHMGNGMYKSSDGGTTWTNMGLSNVGTVSKIIIDPTNTQVIYAGTTGNVFISDNNRGMYKSTDAGVTWNQILFLGLNAGIGDMVINPQNTSTLYCTGRHRFRSNTQSMLNGPETKIFRTTNGGTSWDTLQTGLPSGEQCRIGLTISTTNPNTVYANYVDTSLNYAGLYKTTNGGNTWSVINSSASTVNMGGFGWYFGEVELNPYNNNQLFILGVDLGKSSNGGTSFSAAGNTHSDKHDLKFLSATSMLLATDGGLYKSTNSGTSFQLLDNLPITQFYKVAFNPWMPTQYFGGAQDNGSNYGSANSGIDNWIKFYGADGFLPQFDSSDQSIFYAEWQNGNVMATTDGGSSWDYITSSLTATDRTSWNTPYFVSKHNSNELFIGTYQVYHNTSGPVDSWTPISPDLTDGTNNVFHVITSLNQSQLNSQILYAGTSDARVWYTNNLGGNWNLINSTLPNRNVSCIKASPSITNSVFVSFSGYRNNDSLPHIYYSSNNGSTWASIEGNLPNFAINDIWIHPSLADSGVIVATDGGVYVTKNLGNSWARVGGNMPIIPVYDIEFNPTTQRIFAGTFARSLQSMLIDSVFDFHVHVGISNQSYSNSMRVYPNPTNNMVHVISEFDMKKLFIMDIFGRKILEKTTKGKAIDITLEGLSSGTYYIETTDGKNRSRQAVTKL